MKKSLAMHTAYRPIHRLFLMLSLLLVSASARAETVTVCYGERDGLSSRHVGGAVQDRQGLMWFATWNGLDCYDGYEFHRVRIQPGDSASIGTNLIRDIQLGPEGNIFCRTDYGIYEFDLGRYRFRDISEARRDSLRPRMGRQWRVLADARGTLWSPVPTGIAKTYRPSRPARLLEGTEGTHPRSLLVTRDSLLWVGSRSDCRVRVYSPDLSLVREIQLASPPYCLYQTRGGAVWAGCKPGALFRIEDGRPGPSLAPLAVYDMAEDAAGRLWIATFGGGVVCCPDPDAPEPVFSAPVGGRKVRKIAVTPSGRIVAASTEGLLVGTIDSSDWTKTTLHTIRRDARDPLGLSSDAILSVALGPGGDIYVATESSGVDVIGEEELFGGKPAFARLGGEELPGDICKALAVTADSAVIFAGPALVASPGRREGAGFALSRAFWGDSCRFSEATPVEMPGGTLVFGAEEGAYAVTPDLLWAEALETPLVFTTLAVNGGQGRFVLAQREGISLGASERNISVGYAALDYTDNSGILYRTRLDGSPWSSPGVSRTVSLFNLTPGTHTLEVQSTDRFGRWADNLRALEIEVEPYWHETWWARALGCLLGLALVAGSVAAWLYIRRIDRHRRELLEKYMEVMAADTDQAAAVPDVSESEEGGCEAAPLVPSQSPEDAMFLDRVRRYIEANIANPDANVEEMAEAAAVSRSTLNRRLKSNLGISAAQLMIEARMKHACQLLGDGTQRSLAETAGMCGYADPQYFQRVFRKRFGVAPGEYSAQR